MFMRLQKLIEHTINLIGHATAWLVAALVLNAVAVVLFRYGFNLSYTAMQESVSYLHAAIFMLGACYAFQANAHVSVDFVNARLSIQRRAIIKIVGNLLFLMPFGLTLLWSSYDYVVYSWSLWEHSVETHGLPLVYLLKTLIPILGITLILTGIADTIKQYGTLTDKRPADKHSTNPRV